MNLLKRFIGLIALLFLIFSKAYSTETYNTNIRKPVLLDTFKLYATSAIGSKGDVVTISVKVRNFTDIGSTSFSLTWSNTLLQYVNHTALFTNQTFDVAEVSNGGLGMTWRVNAENQNLPDDTEILRISFKIIGCSGNPTDINFFFIPTTIAAYTSDFSNLRVAVEKGRVLIQTGNGCTVSRPPGETCETAPLLCPSEFPFNGALTRTTRGTYPVPSACFNSSIDNNVWLAFIAGSANIDFKIAAANCTGQGLQAAVIQTDDCVNFPNFKDELGGDINFCQRQIDQGTDKTIQCTGLTVGKQYYIMIDGYNGSLCDFTISITNGNVLGAGTSSISITGSNILCANKDNELFTVKADTNNISEYIWKVPSDAVIKSGQGTPSITVKWGATNGDVCVKTVGRCGTSDWSCKSVTVKGSPESNQNTTICQGSSVTLGGKTYNTAGTYKIILPGQGLEGCDSIVNLTLTVLNFTVTATKSGDIPCDGSAVNLSATISNPQNATLAYEWRNATNTLLTTNLNYTTNVSGTYTLTVKATKNGLTCTQTSTITVTKGGSFAAKPQVSGVLNSCLNNTDAYQIVNPASGISKYNWTITGGNIAAQATTSVNITWNTTGLGKVCVSAENGCGQSDTACLMITIPVAPDSVPIIGNKTVCSNDTTIYSVTANTSVTSFTWQVPNGARILKGQNTNQIQVVWGLADSEPITLIMKNACNQTKQVSSFINIKKSDLLPPTISGSKIVCPGTVAVFSVTPDTKVIEYLWAKPSNGTITKGQGTPSVEVMFADIGTSDVCLQIKNECGVTRSSCFAIEVKNTLDSLPILGPTEICEGSVATFRVQKDANVESYFWFTPGGSSILPGFQGKDSVQIRFGTSGGNVSVSPTGGCADGTVSRLNIKIKQKPTIPSTIAGKTNICERDTLTYSVTPVDGATSYVWTLPADVKIIKGDGTNSITLVWNSIFSGNVSVKAKNECGESSASSRSVAVKTALKPNAGVDATVCGKKYDLNGIANFGTYKWSILSKPPNTTGTFDKDTDLKTSVSVSEAGTYTFALSLSNGTCTNMDTVVLNFKKNPSFSTVNDACNDIATGYQLKFDVLNAKTPLAQIGNISGSFSGTTFTSSTISSGDPYWIVIRDSTGCQSDTLKGVKSCPCLSNAGNWGEDSLVVCFGDKAKVNSPINTNLDGNDGFEFILHDGTRDNVGTVLLRNKTGIFEYLPDILTTNKVYYVSYVVGDAMGSIVDFKGNCTQFLKGNPIIFKDKIDVSLVADTTVCSGTNAILKFKTPATTDLFKIVFSDGSNKISKNNISNNINIIVTPSVTTTYKIIEATNAAGCKAQPSDSAFIKIKARPTVNAGADTALCVREIQLNADVSAGTTINWRSPAGVKVANPADPKSSVSNLQNGKNNFVLVVRDSVCSNYVVYDTVSVFLPLSPEAQNLVMKGYIGDTISTVLNGGAPVGTYTVTRLTNPAEGHFELFSNGKFTYIANVSKTMVASFTYMICSEKCAAICDTGTVKIMLTQRPVIDTVVQVDIPNAITPNGDTKNDMWIMENLEKFPENELIIFNRWGDILYKAKPYQNNWEGTNQNGEPLPEGTYYYVLRLNINDGRVMKGDITVLR